MRKTIADLAPQLRTIYASGEHSHGDMARIIRWLGVRRGQNIGPNHAAQLWRGIRNGGIWNV